MKTARMISVIIFCGILEMLADGILSGVTSRRPGDAAEHVLQQALQLEGRRDRQYDTRDDHSPGVGMRANYVCQRCHKARATEVHHLTYVRVFNELATDLLPVCSACHRGIHHLKPANDNQLPLPFADGG